MPVVVPSKPSKPPLLSTPSSKRDLPRVPPPAVPALRIVKRAKVSGHSKSDSTSSTSSSEGPTFACTGVDLVSARTKPVSTTGRLPVSRVVSPNFTDLGSRNTALRAPASRNNTAPSAPSVPTVNAPVVTGARRVLISDGPSLQPRSRIVANSIQSREGPFRLQRPAPVSNILTKPLAVGGLKRPAKYGSSVGTISNLPKPVSRNGTSNLPTTGLRDGGSSLPARRVV